MNKRKTVVETKECVQKSAKYLFEDQLKSVDMRLKDFDGQISRHQAVSEHSISIKKEARQNKVYKLPLIGRMIHRPKLASKTYRLIISLLDNFKLELLDNQSMQWILEHKDEIYEKYYREDYERRYIAIRKIEIEESKTSNDNAL